MRIIWTQNLIIIQNICFKIVTGLLQKVETKTEDEIIDNLE